MSDWVLKPFGSWSYSVWEGLDEEVADMEKFELVKEVGYRVYRNALRSGDLKKPEKCPRCPSGRSAVGYHPDWSKPLEVIWACRDCFFKGNLRAKVLPSS